MTKDDFIAIMRYLVSLFLQEGYLDDIDHLGNRRVRSVGELLGNQFSLGLTRMARTIRERLSLARHGRNHAPGSGQRPHGVRRSSRRSSDRRSCPSSWIR